MVNATIKTIELADGRTITIETGKLAKQADGSVVVRMGDTMLLATVVSAKEAKENVDFMPLAVDYREKFSAAGRFPGGFLKRESRPSDEEILVARLVDRALRPLFPADYHAETAVMISLIAFIIGHVSYTIFPFAIVSYNVLQLLTVVIFGGFYTFLFIKTKSVVGPMLAHNLLNGIIVLSSLILTFVFI